MINTEIVEIANAPQFTRAFRVRGETVGDIMQHVEKHCHVGQHRYGRIAGRISGTPADGGWWDATVDYSADFHLRCQYAGRPIVLPREPK